MNLKYENLYGNLPLLKKETVLKMILLSKYYRIFSQGICTRPQKLYKILA